MEKKALVITSMIGFMDAFLQEDIKTLQNMGYEVHGAANCNNYTKEQIAEKFESNSINIHHIDFLWLSPISKQTLEAYRQVKKLLEDNRYSVIHCHTPIVGAIVRIAAKKYRRKKGCKVIYTSHGYNFYKGASKKNWIMYYPIEKIMSLLCDAIITINKEDYSVSQKMFCKRVYHINGVGCDTSRYVNVKIDRDSYRESLGIKKDELMILTVGRIQLRKNHKVIIEALSKINNPQNVFFICGKADAEKGVYEELKKTAKENNVKVIFAGHRSDIPEICNCADIGVLPSIREGLGLAGIEMLASGVPLVTSNVQGIKDYMENDVDGYLCDPHDANAFADGIMKLSDKKKRDLMKKNCVEMAKKFDISVSIKQMQNIYSDLLRG